MFPVAGLCLGYPAQQGFISMRLPPEATVHRDRYDDNAVAAVDAYDRRRDARHSIEGSPEITGNLRHRRVLRLVGGQGAPGDDARKGIGFAAWLSAHGFDLDEIAKRKGRLPKVTAFSTE